MIMLNNNLRVFIAVAEKGSITKAANELFISQPAVSKSIKIIEDELQIKLFFRDKRKGLILTDAGQKILKLARQMADEENRIYQTAFRENNFLGGKVRIASMPILTSVYLAPVFHKYREKYPYVSVELIEGSSYEIQQAVQEHRVDIGFTATPFGDLDTQILFQDRMIAITAETSTPKSSVNLLDSTESYIFCKAGYETAAEELRKKNVHLSDNFSVQQAETVIKLVEQKNGTGIISELVLDATANSLTRLPIEPAINIDIGIVANDLSDLTPVAIELKRMIEEEV